MLMNLEIEMVSNFLLIKDMNQTSKNVFKEHRYLSIVLEFVGEIVSLIYRREKFLHCNNKSLNDF